MKLPNINPDTVENLFDELDTPNNVIWFGKHKGKKIEDLIHSETQYIIWCTKNIKGFKLTKEQQDLLDEECENPDWSDIDDTKAVDPDSVMPF